MLTYVTPPYYTFIIILSISQVVPSECGNASNIIRTFWLWCVVYIYVEGEDTLKNSLK